MSALTSFLQAILDDPADDTPRLVFADWLQEQSDLALAARGELMRLQCRLAQWVHDRSERTATQERARALLEAHRETWLGLLADFCTEATFERGLVRITMRGQTFVGQEFAPVAGDLLSKSWVEMVRLEKPSRHLQSLGRARYLEAVAGLDLSGNNLRNTLLSPLFRSAHASRLRRLDLSGNGLPDLRVAELIQSPLAGCLRALDLRNNELTDTSVKLLLGSPLADRLQSLEMHGNKLGFAAQGQLREWQQQKLRTPPGQPARRLTNSIGMDLVLIPAGNFLMGAPADPLERGPSDSEDTTHPVTISRPFYLGVYPVTQQQYQLIMGTNPSFFDESRRGGPNHPVEEVTWREAVEFCRRLSEHPDERKVGRVYRLPTETEWEHACRAGTTTPFYFGNPPSSHKINYDGNYHYGGAPRGPFLARTSPVGSYPPNPFGLYDMHGNVWEWCSDWFSRDYSRRTPEVDPKGPTRGKSKVIKGGCWDCVGWYCRSAHRHGDMPDHRDEMNGFRVAVSLSE